MPHIAFGKQILLYFHICKRCLVVLSLQSFALFLLENTLVRVINFPKLNKHVAFLALGLH